MQRVVLAVDGQDLGAGGVSHRGHELACDDERLLVCERDAQPALERAIGRDKAERSDRCRHDRCGARLGCDGHEAVHARENLGHVRGRKIREESGKRLHFGRTRHRDDLGVMAPDLLCEEFDRASACESRDREPIRE